MTIPEDSEFFAVAAVDYTASVDSNSDGDLWPSAWADDGALYTACGDGLGFATAGWSDIVVNRLEGDPATGLRGERLASGRDVAPIWTDPDRFNSKPTGMLAVDGNGDGRDELYLAVQDLRCGDTPHVFDHAPAAGIVRSDDRGSTWAAGDGVLFRDLFTTVMFLDFGRSNSRAQVLRELTNSEGPDPAGYAYAYGLDHNWRTSHSGIVPDPTELFLARVPVGSIQDRDRWEFFAGSTGARGPTWSPAIADKCAVLTDTRRRYRQEEVLPGIRGAGGTLIGQGGVVFIPAFRRFIYSSWSECTFEFYESPTPWGPWRHFLTNDFGPPPWIGPRVQALAKQGGYAPTIPSKFISADGRSSWVQSNWFGGAATYTGNTYHFSLRSLRLDPAPTDPDRSTGDGSAAVAGNLARANGARPFGSAVRCGQIGVLNDERLDRAEDSWNGRRGHDEHYWGYTWPEAQRIERVVYTTGQHDYTGGWFTQPPRVQMRRGARWVDAEQLTTTPSYPCDYTATGTKRFTLRFNATTSTGLRLIGPPGGIGGPYTSIAELEVYAGANGQETP